MQETTGTIRVIDITQERPYLSVPVKMFLRLNPDDCRSECSEEGGRHWTRLGNFECHNLDTG
jgi:hypothetical protein